MQLLTRTSLALFCGLALFGGPAWCQPAVQIKKDLRAYVAALNSKHPAVQASPFVYAAKTGAATGAWEKYWIKERNMASRRASSSPQGIEWQGVEAVSVRGNRAQARVKINWFTIERAENLQLVRVANPKSGAATWQIVPGTAQSLAFDSNRPLEQAAFFLSQGAAAMPLSIAKSEMRSLKNLTINLFSASPDSNNPLFSQKTLNAAQSNGRFPASLRIAGTRDSYVFNARLNGKRLEQVPQPATTVLLYDGKAHRLRPRYKGQGVVAFADGHIELLTQRQLNSKIW